MKVEKSNDNFLFINKENNRLLKTLHKQSVNKNPSELKWP